MNNIEYNDILEFKIEKGVSKCKMIMTLPYRLHGAFYLITNEDKLELEKTKKEVEENEDLDGIIISWNENNGSIILEFGDASISLIDNKLKAYNVFSINVVQCFHKIASKYREILESKI
jgi:hypothetical protein